MGRLLVLITLATTFIGATYTEDPAPKIEWMDFNEGFELAQKEGKVAVIDCYTEWCGWCKVMDKKTFTDTSIIRRFNENYIAIKFNPEEDGKYDAGAEDSLTGPELLMALSNNKPSGYPTFFFYVPQGKKMFQVPGYQDVEKFTTTLDGVERYKDAVTLKTP
jgi:thioredoxin-related protein